MPRTYVDWAGINQRTAGNAEDARLVVNCDFRHHGELRRRPGMTNRLDHGGNAAVQVYVSGRYYLVSHDAGALAAERLT